MFSNAWHRLYQFPLLALKRCYCHSICFILKISPTDVCGCPLVTNVFEETGDFCRASKRTCLKHYCWEKLRRAEIDLQRIQQVRVCLLANAIRDHVTRYCCVCRLRFTVTPAFKPYLCSLCNWGCNLYATTYDNTTENLVKTKTISDYKKKLFLNPIMQEHPVSFSAFLV